MQQGTATYCSDRVTQIYAFGFCTTPCTALTAITIGSGVTDMENVSFKGCRSLKSITIGGNVNRIKFESFYNCEALTSINFLGLNLPIIIEPTRQLGCCELPEPEVRLWNVLGHAYAKSNFPPPGNYFGELMMGEHIPEKKR